MKPTLNFNDYLFLQFRTITPTLEQVCAVYYPNLKREKILEKARKLDFPFPCYKIGGTQKSPYFVNLADLSDFLIEALNINSKYLTTDVQQVCKEHISDELK